MSRAAAGIPYDRLPLFDLIPLCPQCRAKIHWYAYGLAIDDPGSAMCSNSPKATRIIVDPQTAINCNWEGFVKRNKDGRVIVYDHSGQVVPYRIVKYG